MHAVQVACWVGGTLLLWGRTTDIFVHFTASYLYYKIIQREQLPRVDPFSIFCDRDEDNTAEFFFQDDRSLPFNYSC